MSGVKDRKMSRSRVGAVVRAGVEAGSRGKSEARMGAWVGSRAGAGKYK